MFTPLVVPLPHSAVARRLNGRILRATVRWLRRRLDIDEFQLWTFIPQAAAYMCGLDESSSVFYCTGVYSMFSSVDTAGTRAVDRDLVKRVDCVFAGT